jgi:hypothetical protein
MDGSNQRDTKLNKEEFAFALQKGLGRTLLHVKQQGLCGIDDLVLQACLHNQAWDAQAEGNKSEWLFSMFYETSFYTQFCEAIFTALGIETDTWNLDQLFGLALEVARHGNANALDKIKERALKIAVTPSSDDWLGARELIEMTGNTGILELTRLYGQRLVADTEDFVPTFEILPKNVSEEYFVRLLADNSIKDPAIKVYLEHIARSSSFRRSSNLAIVEPEVIRNKSKELRRQRVRSEWNLDRILNAAEAKAYEYPSYYMQFGRCATEEELETIYHAFLKEDEDDVCLRLLWVFRRASLPLLDEKVLLLADHKNDHLKEAALTAMSQITDSRIHDFAKNKIKMNEILGVNTAVIDLFIKNYDSDDAESITRALLSSKPNMEDIHNLVYNLTQVAKHQQDERLVNALEWGYEMTPCSNCRFSVVTELNRIGHFQGTILHECQFDASQDIRDLAKKTIGS